MSEPWETKADEEIKSLRQQLAAAPWHDYPTHVGLWFGQFRDDGGVLAVRIDEAALVGISAQLLIKRCRWYPVPADTPPAAEKGAQGRC